MLERCHNAQERWGGVNQMIDRWLSNRRELIRAYQACADQQTFGSGLGELCGQLVDYCSVGHFEIYENLLAEARAFGDTQALDVANRIYSRLQAITLTTLTFNDRWGSGVFDLEQSARLMVELDQLAAELDERFELEDCLIEILHNTHNQKVSA